MDFFIIRVLKTKKKTALTLCIIFIHRYWSNWNFPSGLQLFLPSFHCLATLRKKISGKFEKLTNKLQNIGMQDYLGRNLVGEMESSKIIDEVNLFRNRPNGFWQHNTDIRLIRGTCANANQCKCNVLE